MEIRVEEERCPISYEVHQDSCSMHVDGLISDNILRVYRQCISYNTVLKHFENVARIQRLRNDCKKKKSQNRNEIYTKFSYRRGNRLTLGRRARITFQKYLRIRTRILLFFFSSFYF